MKLNEVDGIRIFYINLEDDETFKIEDKSDLPINGSKNGSN
jgi:hypothetical protein